MGYAARLRFEESRRGIVRRVVPEAEALADKLDGEAAVPVSPCPEFAVCGQRLEITP